MRNIFEQEVAKQLKKRKKVFEYEKEKLDYTLERHYIPDFIVSLPASKTSRDQITPDRKSRTLYIECKGYLRIEDKSKLKAVLRCHPGIDLRILFDSDRNLKRNQKWCEKNNIPCAAINIPTEWFK
jgi:hypothetical protein